MNFRRVAVDTNVILDPFIPDRSTSDYSVAVMDRVSENGSKLLISCDLITTAYYFLAKITRVKR